MPEDTSRKVVLPPVRTLMHVVDSLEAGRAYLQPRGHPANYPSNQTAPFHVAPALRPNPVSSSSNQTAPFHAAPALRPNPVPYHDGSFPASAASLTPQGVFYPSDSNASLPRTQNAFVSPGGPWSSTRAPRVVPPVPTVPVVPTLRRVQGRKSTSSPPICACTSPRVSGIYTAERVLFIPLNGPPERGISLLDIFEYYGGTFMHEPAAEPLNFLGTMDFVLNINGKDFPAPSRIPSNCVHHRITRWHLAKWIAIAFRMHLDVPLRRANLISFESAEGGMWRATIQMALR